MLTTSRVAVGGWLESLLRILRVIPVISPTLLSLYNRLICPVQRALAGALPFRVGTMAVAGLGLRRVYQCMYAPLEGRQIRLNSSTQPFIKNTRTSLLRSSIGKCRLSAVSQVAPVDMETKRPTSTQDADTT